MDKNSDIHFGQMKEVMKGFREYGRIKSTEFPSFGMKSCNASLTKLKVLLPQSHDCSCYVNISHFHLSDF